MGGASSYYSILSITAFLIAIWLASKLSRMIGISSIVLEITVGLLLSPQVFKFLPTEYSVCYHDTVIDCKTYHDKLLIAELGTSHCDLQAYLDAGKYGIWQDAFFKTETVTLHDHFYNMSDGGDGQLTGDHHRRLTAEDALDMWSAGTRRLSGGGAEGKSDYASYEACLEKKCKLELANKCATTPNIMTLIGHTGVAMMIFESGMHFDFEQAKTVGGKACAVAVLGTLLPLIAGTGVIMAFGFDFINGFAAGTSLAPTSVGIALRLLHEAKALQTYFGQTIITAAFVDDILSLILYNILFSLQGGMTFMTFLPLILGIIFMMVAAGAGASVCPKLIAWMLSKVKDKKANSKLSTHHELLFVCMVATLILYAQITHLCGTHLWGCFIAGMSFAMWKDAHHIWVRQTKRITVWMIRIFFAATVAFAIPVKDLLSIDSFLKGAVMGIGPCILTKVCCAFFMGDARFVIGWAMVGRAEFAYLIAQMAAASNMMEPAVFSIVIWALLWATVFAPFIFRAVLSRYIKKKAGDPEADEDAHQRADNLEHPVGNGRHLSTGHLPDMYDEEMARQEQDEAARHKKMEDDIEVMKNRVKDMEERETDYKAQIAALQEMSVGGLKALPADQAFEM